MESSEASRFLGNVGSTGGPYGSSRRDKCLQGRAVVRKILLDLNSDLKKDVVYKLTFSHPGSGSLANRFAERSHGAMENSVQGQSSRQG